MDVAKAFYTVLKEARDLEIIEGIHESLKERISDLSEREKIGRSRPSEIATANSRMKLSEADLASVKGQLIVAENNLVFLIGMPVQANQLKDDEIQGNIEKDLPTYLKAVELRSDVQAVKESMKAAWQNIVIAQSGLWPGITLEGNQYQKREGFQSGIDWDLLFKITVPIFKGGENVGKIKEAISLWKQGKLSFALAERQADLEIRQAYSEWKSSQDEHRAFQEALKASEENFNLQKDEYSRNLVNNLDVLEALESFHQTRQQANFSYYKTKENFWKLKVTAGEVAL